LLPPLDKEAFRLLEENILENGCRDPLVVWNGILIDGYNRYKICSEHNIPFKTVDKEFESREEVLIRISRNQVSRRNLMPIQLSHYRGLHYNADKKIQRTNNQYITNMTKSEKGQNDPFHFLWGIRCCFYEQNAGNAAKKQLHSLRCGDSGRNTMFYPASTLFRKLHPQVRIFSKSIDNEETICYILDTEFQIL